MAQRVKFIRNFWCAHKVIERCWSCWCLTLSHCVAALWWMTWAEWNNLLNRKRWFTFTFVDMNNILFFHVTHSSYLGGAKLLINPTGRSMLSHSFFDKLNVWLRYDIFGYSTLLTRYTMWAMDSDFLRTDCKNTSLMPIIRCLFNDRALFSASHIPK